MIQEAVLSGAWEQASETFFEIPVHYRDFADFEERMIGVTYANHRLDASSCTLPPAAVVLTVMVCSAQKRYR